MDLPGGGRLHLDRPLPYLCVYRRPSEAGDSGTQQLIAEESAYAVIPSDPRAANRATQLLRTVVQQLASQFGSFLLIEIWSAALAETTEPLVERNGDGQSSESRFEIIAHGARIPRATLEALSKSLGRDVMPFGGTSVVLGSYGSVAPAELKPLVRLGDMKQWNCFALGLVVRPVYRDEDTHEVLPEVLRSVCRTVHCGLEQAFFAFVQQRKALRPGHLHAPGRRSVVESVFAIARPPAEIDRSFDLLLQATPVNAESAWREFRRGRFDKPPTFYYRPLSIDPTLLKRQLYLIPVERIDDPTLSYLFRQKQEELDRQITLLSDVDTPRFLPESQQIYGGVSDWLLNHAVELLDQVPKYTREEPRRHQLDATEFAQRALQELGYYQQQCADFCATVSVRDDMYAGLMVSGDQLLIGGKIRVPR